MANWDVTTAGAALEFDTQNGEYNSCFVIDENHFINFYQGLNSDGFVQAFTVNTSTWAVTTANSPLEFDILNCAYNSCYQIDDNHFINFSQGDGSDGFAQTFEVNTSTWAITTANSTLEFDTVFCFWNSCYRIDPNHFINFWGGTDFDGFAQIFEVSTSTWAITTANASLEFDTQGGDHHSCWQVDSNHFINFWRDTSNHGIVQIFEVNTSTWAVTTAGALFEFDTQLSTYNSCYQVDINHFINFRGGVDSDGYVQIFEVNTSTWAVTTAGANLEFDTQNCSYNSCYQIDDNHFINFFRGDVGTDGYVQTFEVNTSTWDVTTAEVRLEFDTQSCTWNSCYKIDTNHFINFWTGIDNDGYVQAFAVELPPTSPTFDGSPTVTAVTKTTATGNANITSANGFTITERGWVVAETTAPTTGDSKFTTAGTTGAYTSDITGLTEGTAYYARPYATTSDGTPTTTYGAESSFTTKVNYQVTTAGAVLEFDTQYSLENSCYQIDSNHFINFWAGADFDGFVQTFTVNTSTWAVTTANSQFEFDTVSGRVNSCYQIDSNHFINFWRGDASDGFVQTFTVDTSTWAITTASTPLEFDTVGGSYNSCFIVDSNHFINFWQGVDSDGFTQIFEVNTTTFAVTTAGAKLEFDTQDNWSNSCFVVDTNHFINFWRGFDADGFAQTFEVNTTTWAVTTAGARLEFDTRQTLGGDCYQIDENHFINFWEGSVDTEGYTQVFEVNTTTWAITTAGAWLEFDTQNGSKNACYQVDSNHFINFWRGGAGYDGYTQTFTVNTSTWAVTTAAASFNFDTNDANMNSCFIIDSNHFINFWGGLDADGYVQAFSVELPDAAGGGDDTIFFSANF